MVGQRTLFWRAASRIIRPWIIRR